MNELLANFDEEILRVLHTETTVNVPSSQRSREKFLETMRRRIYALMEAGEDFNSATIRHAAAGRVRLSPQTKFCLQPTPSDRRRVKQKRLGE